MTEPRLTLVAALTADRGIGHEGGLIVRISDDLKRLKAMTLGHAVVMGRVTWDSIGRPLPGRRNIVVTRQPDWHADGALRAGSLDDALAIAGDDARVFVLGGAEIYAAALPLADTLELTLVDAIRPADAFFPPWSEADFRQTSREEHALPDGTRYAFTTWRRIGPSQTGSHAGSSQHVG